MNPIAFVAHSRCECQASLRAELSDARHVLSGSAFLRGRRETAPAHSIGADAPIFQIAWACPYCSRNVLRSFTAASLPRPGRTAGPASL